MEVIMPKMGESVNEGTIIKWHKKPGEAVKRDEIIFEISTDKVDTEVPSPVDGTLSKILVNEGETVEVGTAVGVIDSGEAAPQEKVEPEPKLVREKKTEEKPQAEEKPKTEEKSQTAKPKEEIKKEFTQTEKAPSKDVQGETVNVAMPKMGESVMEGTIIKWYKKVGDSVKKDETIFEISTDKVDTEVPSPAEGTLTEILVAEQETVEVGTVVAKISSGKKDVNVQAEGVVEKQKEEHKEVSSMHDNFSKTTIEKEEENADEESNKFLSPVVMNIIKQEKIPFSEVNKIKGTGASGRVTKNDVLKYLETRKEQPQKIERQPEFAPQQKTFEPSSQISKTEGYGQGVIERIPMDNIRQKIMQHMIASRDTSVHVSATIDVDMTKIHNYLEKNRDELFKKEGIKLTYMAFISYACVRALKEYPIVNSTIDGTTILKKKFINLGIAVAIEPAGLIVPNIKNAEDKNIFGLAKAIHDLAARARTKKLSPDEVSGGTFTITNYGVFGLTSGTPIINQPEVAILGVGTIIKKPVVIDVDGNDMIAIRPMMTLTISHDHRLIDGMQGGMFIKKIKDELENFSFN
ncbi:MAG TPA: 2-oxoglutarate dehydrogenase, E2 component, dihydrolipoamide succinyltransferase [Ignavibacteriaceae bacterium]|nr:2-oxoglutarate dehydrogenase, E2 component, dihydrolipoamide succinyltransferase [Ignavibacteriaceae bacterium]